jgi:hypothetical protein
MSSATPTKPNPIPAILVYGTPASRDLTQASRFRAEDKQAGQSCRPGAELLSDRHPNRSRESVDARRP